MSDELKFQIGDWVVAPDGGNIGQVAAKSDARYFSLDFVRTWVGAHGGRFRLATPQEIAAATGQPQEEKIEVGDVVDWYYGGVEKGDRNPHWSGSTVLKCWPDGDYTVQHPTKGTGLFRKGEARLVSKGKSGQGEGTLTKEPVKLDAPVKRTGAPCPACSGSIHGPGRIADWNDKPIACPRCQYGKPKPEAVIARPYHKILPSGECVIALIHDIGCRPTPTQADELTEKLHRDTEWDRQQARAALEKAQAEARRLGILK